MDTRNPVSTATIGDHPLHPMLVPFPIAFLVATLACDLDESEPKAQSFFTLESPEPGRSLHSLPDQTTHPRSRFLDGRAEGGV
jgi:hypothetical protein